MYFTLTHCNSLNVFYPFTFVTFLMYFTPHLGHLPPYPFNISMFTVLMFTVTIDYLMFTNLVSARSVSIPVASR